MKNNEAFITVDIGNSFIKYGLFTNGSIETCFPLPVSICVEMTSVFSDLSRWLIEQGGKFRRLSWIISSVNEKRTASLRHWIERHRPWDPTHVISYRDVPLQIEYDHPDKLGIDRIVAAFAAQKLLKMAGPILVVDIGTATTIDLIGNEGVFLGGAILPGPQMSAQVLYEKTEQLPHALLNSRKNTSSSSERKMEKVENKAPETKDTAIKNIDSKNQESEIIRTSKDFAARNDFKFRKDSGKDNLLKGSKKKKPDSFSGGNGQGLKAGQIFETGHNFGLNSGFLQLNTLGQPIKISEQDLEPTYPAKNTEDGIQLGICSSLIGAVFSFYIDSVRQLMAEKSKLNATFQSVDASKQTRFSAKDLPMSDPLSIPIVIAERGSRLIEKPLSDFFDHVTGFLGALPKPKIRTCSFLILSGLAVLAQQYLKNYQLDESDDLDDES